MNILTVGATWDGAANCRQQVLVACREFEDNLFELRILEDQIKTQDVAVTSSSRASELSRREFEKKPVNYLDVIDAQCTVLQARRSALQLSGARAVATVNLIRALGGG